ncbi:MAG: radical SAM protein, partial [Deltaproteobacteria bacterium]|nr:radical SAM protein [Deltaproteobacteria bacterium]
MDCSGNIWPSTAEYLGGFRKKASKLRVPVSGSIDLTHRCNLHCVHCYLGGRSGEGTAPERELTTDEWISILDRITEAGCLYLLVTGGEPLLKKDFAILYSHAKKNGMLVTVFTNGTMIDDDVLELFSRLPPREVEITLYGATPETYEHITGVKGSYGRCMEGIRRLRDARINVNLKTVLMTLNRHEFDPMREIAEAFGVRFRFDAAVFPRFNGDTSPMKLRVSPEEAVEKEASNGELLRQWVRLYERLKNMPVSDRLYQCGAGLTAFHIDPYGHLRPCLMSTSTAYGQDLRSMGFETAWKVLGPA